ncbi:MAG TPA: hypothetical protein VFW50_04890 [Streptosporangiaceae bacterium]|nr:hypothetical protein [Streptosporangiaceae bacterium]
MVVHGIRPHPARWLLERRLSRRTPADFVGFVVKILAIRLYSATACFISMLLAAWVGAFVRVVSAHDWHVFRTLNETTILAASAQAARYQGVLFPVLLLWAVLLLLTPIRYTLAFYSAVVAAGILGYLRLDPPSFLVTTWVTAISHWLVRFGGRGGILYLISAIGVACVLLSSAVAEFGRLDHLHRKARRASYAGRHSRDVVRKLCAIPLILLALLSVTWAVTVVRLAASGSGISPGYQGALHQSEYLLVLIAIAIAIPGLANGGKWLIVAVIFTTWYSLAPDVLSLLPALEISAGRGELIHIGTAWGADSLWAALFIFIPSAVFGIYLITALLRPE